MGIKKKWVPGCGCCQASIPPDSSCTTCSPIVGFSDDFSTTNSTYDTIGTWDTSGGRQHAENTALGVLSRTGCLVSAGYTMEVQTWCNISDTQGGASAGVHIAFDGAGFLNYGSLYLNKASASSSNWKISFSCKPSCADADMPTSCALSTAGHTLKLTLTRATTTTANYNCYVDGNLEYTATGVSFTYNCDVPIGLLATKFSEAARMASFDDLLVTAST